MRSVALSVVLVILLAVGAGPVAAASQTATDGSLTAGSEPVDTGPTPVASERYALQPTGDRTPVQLDRELTPTTTFAISLRGDRSADWTVTVEYDLTSESQRAAFSELAAEFEAGTATGGVDPELYENLATIASEQTGRSMAIQDVDRFSSLDDNVGTLQLSFTWTGFLEEDGESLVFNDALRTPDNDTWLTSLGENQQLRITTPRGYAITSANVGFSDNTVVVEGPHTFDPDEHIRITLEPSSFTGPSWELLAAAVVVAVAIIGGALLLRRQDDAVDATPQAETNGGADAVEYGGADAVEPADAPPTDEPHNEGEPDEPAEDLSLLADDERVLRLLKRNSGRMRQAEIVSETEWSDAKVSQLLSSMADDDRIEKLRIGRENLISLPNVDALDGSVDDSDEE